MWRMSDPRFPIGRFTYTPAKNKQERGLSIDSIAALPAKLRQAVSGMDREQLDTPYRDGGWTVRQVVHHLPDSHLNSYLRFKCALTEDAPAIKTYEEDRWAELPDSRGDVEVSLLLLDALHRRWVLLLRQLTDEQWQRTFVHPQQGAVALERALALYAWHSEHHLAHVNSVAAKPNGSSVRSSEQ